MIFNYQQMMRDNSVKESELPEEIRQSINALHELDYDLEEDFEEADSEMRAIKEDLRNLDREICQLIKEELDNESEEDLPAAEIKAGIIHEIYQSGLKAVKVAHLKKAGYPVPTASKWTEKTGEYTLRKNMYEETVHISK